MNRSICVQCLLMLRLLFDYLIIKVKGHQYQWSAGGYDLEIEHF